MAVRWQGRHTPVPNLLSLLLATFCHEGERRDRDGHGAVDELEFVESHSSVTEAFAHQSDRARASIAKAAGGVFDGLDLDRDGCIDLADLQACAGPMGVAQRTAS